MLLAAAVRRLEACLRVTDLPPTLRHGDLVAHCTQDEFAILLDGLKEMGHAVVAAERILAELSLPFSYAGREVRLSPSLGIAVSATGYDHADHVLRDANMAMQRARHLGGGSCEVFDRAALQAAQTELRLEADFAGALDRGEFAVVYQPIAVARLQPHRRLRSAGALAASRARTHRAARVHPARREDRLHRAARRVGAA